MTPPPFNRILVFKYHRMDRVKCIILKGIENEILSDPPCKYPVYNSTFYSLKNHQRQRNVFISKMGFKLLFRVKSTQYT